MANMPIKRLIVGSTPKAANRLKHDLGVGMSSELNAARLEFDAQILKVVYLAVIGDDVTAVARDHRLMSGRRQIDDRKSSLSQCEPIAFVDPDALVVRSAVFDRLAHGLAQANQAFHVTVRSSIHDTCNSAHRLSNPI